MERFNEYLNENVLPEKGVALDWAKTVLEDRIIEILKYTFNTVRHRLTCKMGYFGLYGIDFMIDTDLKVYLIEVNVNPCVARNCEALKDVVTETVQETIHIALECF